MAFCLFFVVERKTWVVNKIWKKVMHCFGKSLEDEYVKIWNCKILLSIILVNDTAAIIRLTKERLLKISMCESVTEG